MRRHYCPNSRAFRERTRRIVTAMVERYGSRTEVIGWQIDNEWGGGKTTRCYCSHCRAAFRGWLKARYGSLEALNEAWGTVFWSQTYAEWEHIDPPPAVHGKANPSQALDFDRFTSDSWVDYQQLQVDLLREVVGSRQFITTNLMGLFSELDYYRLAEALDIVTWDNYPTGQTERLRDILYGPSATDAISHAYDTGDPAIVGMAHDLTRSLKNQPFWVMEQQPGYINWADYNPTPSPGVVRLWTWDAIAHGADAVVYFRWRACRLAQEQLHSGLLRHDGHPDQGLLDIRAMQDEQAVMQAVQGTSVASEVAILHSYEDLWALSLQPHIRDFDYLRHLFAYYRALQRAGVPVDMAPPTRDLSRFKLVIAPTLFLVDEDVVANLWRYVQSGGHLLLSVRSGFKTASNLVTGDPLPGRLASLVGATVDSWTSLPPGVEMGVEWSSIPGVRMVAVMWAEALEPSTAEAMAHFTDGILRGRVAATTHRIGDGRVTYLGAWAGGALLESVLSQQLDQAGVSRLARLPVGVKAMRRQGDAGDYMFLLNFGEADTQVELEETGFVDALAPGDVVGQVQVPGRGVRILRRPTVSEVNL